MSAIKRDLTRIRHNTKIVATLGPGSNNVDLLRDMISIGGVHVVRFNFSHGTPEFHEENARIVREASRQAGLEVAIMADLQGPKIRVSKIAGGSIQVEAGEKLLFDAALEGEGTRERVGLDYRELPNDVKTGDVLLLDDGLLTVTVEKVVGSEIHTVCNNSHTLKSNKGINKQGGGLTAAALTAKDMEDIKTAIGLQADYVAVSFPKSGTDMEMARQLCNVAAAGQRHRPGLIAKIERAEAIANLKEILLASDGIMVARGDLAVEVGHAAVPALQKRMIRLAREHDRLIITATQMMESMINNPVPTRAEVSDVANAVLDGTDAVMLSAETAAGRYPLETVQAMASVCEEAEKHMAASDHEYDGSHSHLPRIDQAIAASALHAAALVGAKAIVALTDSGSTALWMSRRRIGIPIYALTPRVATQRKMALYRNVIPMLMDTSADRDEALRQAESCLLRHGVVSQGDIYAITCGEPMGAPGGTNMLKISRVG